MTRKKQPRSMGALIRTARIAEGLTQSELAARMGPDTLGRVAGKWTVAHWEADRQVPQRRLAALLRALPGLARELGIFPGYVIEAGGNASKSRRVRK